MNRNQRRMAAYNARKEVEQREADTYARKVNRAFTKLSEGCSLNVARATSAPSLRDKHGQEQTLLIGRKLHYVRPEATHVVNARQKMRGKSIPLI